MQDKIKEILKHNEWTQKRLADEVGVAVNTVNRWANGHHKPAKCLERIINGIYEEVWK